MEGDYSTDYSRFFVGRAEATMRGTNVGRSTGNIIVRIFTQENISFLIMIQAASEMK